jgi:V/A-type H+-transporting ATPase subunit A
MVLDLYHQGLELLGIGVPVQQLLRLPILGRVRRVKSAFGSDELGALDGLGNELRTAFDALRFEYAGGKEKAAP